MRSFFIDLSTYVGIKMSLQFEARKATAICVVDESVIVVLEFVWEGKGCDEEMLNYGGLHQIMPRMIRRYVSRGCSS